MIFFDKKFQLEKVQLNRDIKIATKLYQKRLLPV